MSAKECAILVEALERQRVLGSSEFCVTCEDFAQLVEWGLTNSSDVAVRLNRPHVGALSLIHRAFLRGMTFYCVSLAPLRFAR